MVSTKEALLLETAAFERLSFRDVAYLGAGPDAVGWRCCEEVVNEEHVCSCSDASTPVIRGDQCSDLQHARTHPIGLAPVHPSDTGVVAESDTQVEWT